MNSRIYIGDARDVLPTLREEFEGRIALLVTSPPYFVARGYEKYLETVGDYWLMIYETFEHVYDLIEPFGKVAINFADKYANAKEEGRPLEKAYLYDYMNTMWNYDLWARIIWDKVRVMIDGARHTTNKGRFEGSMRVAPNWEYIFVWRKYIDGMKVPKKELDMTKEEWAENTVDNMDGKVLYRMAYDVVFDYVKDMSDKEFQEYLTEQGYEEE